MGTWIEMFKILSRNAFRIVVPYVGTWIEILVQAQTFHILHVVPYVGTWIEINAMKKNFIGSNCRSLRGNVDRNACRYFPR